MGDVIYRGNLGKDPAWTDNQTAAKASIAIYTGKDKAPKWVTVMASTPETSEPSMASALMAFSKGDRVEVEGNIRLWTSSDGKLIETIWVSRIEAHKRDESRGLSESPAEAVKEIDLGDDIPL